MSDSRREAEADRSPRETTDGGPMAADGGEHRSAALQSRVVAYADGPDRCTIFPVDASRDERMSTWLTASVDAFVDLERTR